MFPPRPPAGTAPRSETGPLLMLYLVLLMVTVLVGAGHFTQKPALGGVGFLLFGALLLWYLLLWPLGSLTAATVWQWFLGLLTAAVLWFVLCRFVLPPLTPLERNGQVLFLNGLAFVALGGGLLGWLLGALVRRRSRHTAVPRTPPPFPPPLPRAGAPLPPLAELEDLE